MPPTGMEDLRSDEDVFAGRIGGRRRSDRGVADTQTNSVLRRAGNRSHFHFCQ